MCRNLSQPLDAGVLQGHVGVEALGDGVSDQGGALFLEQLDQPLFLGDEGVDFGRLAVEEGGDGALFGEGVARGVKLLPTKIPVTDRVEHSWSRSVSMSTLDGCMTCSVRMYQQVALRILH